jgi:hypothetical protein
LRKNHHLPIIMKKMNFQFVITKHAVVVLLLASMTIPCRIAGSPPPCADTLAATSSQVKDCNLYLLGAPCDTSSFGTETNAVCAKTCGVCSEDGGTATTSTPSNTPNVVVFDASSLPCEDTLAATSSKVKDCSLLLLVAPCGTVSSEIETNAVCAKTCGVCNGGSSTGSNYVLDGLVQSEFMILGEDDKDASILLVGGEYGWNNAPADAIEYADVSVTVDTILRFVYHVGFLNVALVPSAQALQDCDVSQAQILGNDFDSPFDLNLDMMIYTPGDKLFITSARELSTTSTGPAADECQFGARFKVTIVAKEEDEDGNDSRSSVVSFAASLFVVVMLSAILW